MTNTTLIRNHDDMPTSAIDGCHDGVGEILCTTVMGGADDRRLNFMHDDILPPGTSIGVHTHEADEEYYYILTGTGIMTLDDARHSVGPGTITAVYPGGNHGLENTGDEDMRIIVFSVS
ncbi:MAG TPA: cupin domain-containing protein [Armatimonadota bacterium]|nr:cupin domain-containing protein [Armatimonadota bacterium]